MSTTRQIAVNRLKPPKARRPVLCRRHLKTGPLCPIPGRRRRSPPEAKANFAQPQSAQQKIGFVPSFCLASTPAGPEPVPPALEGRELQVLDSIGGLCGGSLANLKSSPSPPLRSGRSWPKRVRRVTRPGVPPRREIPLAPKRLPRNAYAPHPRPTIR
jgi:hypothetical protein